MFNCVRRAYSTCKQPLARQGSTTSIYRVFIRLLKLLEQPGEGSDATGYADETIGGKEKPDD